MLTLRGWRWALGLVRLRELGRSARFGRSGRSFEPGPDADTAELLRLARASFVQLQAAWDRGDLEALARLATEPLLEDLRGQLAERGPHENRTEVVALDARLLAMEEMREAFVASVEFSGLIRERLGEAASPFRELWLLANVKAAGRGWQLARVQSLS